MLTIPLAGSGVAAPALSLNPTTVNFGTQQVGVTSTPQTVTATNSGADPLTIRSVVLAGTNHGNFATSVDTCTGATVAPSASCQVSVTFTPPAVGTRTALLRFVSNAPSSPDKVTLQGNGGTTGGGTTGGGTTGGGTTGGGTTGGGTTGGGTTGGGTTGGGITHPILTVTPSGVTFGEEPIGITSFPQSLTISSSGGSDLRISTISIVGGDRASFAKSADTCDRVTLAPGNSCSVGITFKPSSSGAKAASLRIDSNADGSPHNVGITGLGIAPVVTFSPPGVSFGILPMGIISSPTAITVSNSGNAPLRIGRATIGGANASDFAKSADTCSGASLSPGTSCSVGVTFTPSAAGSRTARLDIGQSSPGNLGGISLTGIGAQPTLTFAPPGLNFGDQKIDQTSAPQAVTVSNTGAAVMTVSTVGLEGQNAPEFAKSSDTCSGMTLLPGRACTVGITFTPRAAGTRFATLTVTDDAPGSPHTMSIVGGLGPPLREPIVGMAATPSGRGYWLAARDGGVFAFGDAGFQGSLGGIKLNEPIVGMAATPSGLGYWLVAADGGIFAFGDAQFRGSTANLVLARPIVGMAASPFGTGYWLVASDGGVFALGDAGFFGSTGALRLSQPVVGMTASPSAGGYWLVASDGGVFAFGDSSFFGSTGNLRLVQPIAGIAATRTALGYWLVAADGGIFAFGDAAFQGSTGGSLLKHPVIGMAPTPTGKGYWSAVSDGGVFTFGDALFLGSAPR
ncbi:MAG TPA: choice-of-anchor D domain-containing protein [Actinomycetota bacterium]